MGQKRKSNAVQKAQAQKRKRLLDEEIASLEEKIKDITPETGTNATLDDQDTEDGATPIPIKFSNLPISTATLNGLRDSKFTRMTDIQRFTIPHILAGRDVLAAAKTGSGKTLAFLVPTLEKLFRQRWCHADGLGALIISPTRELALQIFDVLRYIGKYHSFSAGLVIGGKDQKAEEERIGAMNILVCTPGRLLHHLDVSPNLSTENLQILILDEADRILDMGFERCMNAIIQALPKKRQTLLFSATQTKSVKSLARLSLENPEYIAAHEQAEYATPDRLQQNVLFCSLEDKVNTIWSFLRTHTNEKSIIFLTSCKQVRFMYESFKLLQPGQPLLALHGKIKQMKRLSIYKSFCEREGGCALFATDLASRGLDFKNVDWVVQADCPENTDTYIHRVGRTARYRKKGKALLVLLPSEAKMLEHLESRRIPLKQIKVNPKKNQDIQNLLLGLNSQNAELKYLAQKAFVSYVRSVHLNGNKDVFVASELPLKEFAESLGLIGTPRIRFIQKLREDKNIPDAVRKARQELEDRKVKKDELSDSENQESDSEYESDEEADNNTTAVKTKAERQRKRVNQGTFSEHYQKLVNEEEESEEDDILVPKRTNHDINDEEVAPVKLSNRKKRRLMADNISGLQKKLTFDDEGNVMNPAIAAIQNLPEGKETTHEEYISSIKEELKAGDREDYLHAKQIRREKKQKQKERAKMEAMEGAGVPIAMIASPVDDDDMGYGSYEDSHDESVENEVIESDEDESTSMLSKRSRPDDSSDPEEAVSKKQKIESEEDVEDIEARALRILESKGL